MKDTSLFVCTCQLILASASPRRQELLAAWGIPFLVLPADPQAEPLPQQNEPPEQFAARAARAKAISAWEKLGRSHEKDRAGRHACADPVDEDNAVSGPAVIGVDTVVDLEGRILGKPKDVGEALDFLRLLNGASHTVHSACAILSPFGERLVRTSTRVRFARYPDSVLRAYAQSGEGLDKAGSYAVQGRGAFLVRELQGSFTGVVGLPVAELAQALLDMHILVPLDQKETPCTGATD